MPSFFGRPDTEYPNSVVREITQFLKESQYFAWPESFRNATIRKALIDKYGNPDVFGPLPDLKILELWFKGANHIRVTNHHNGTPLYHWKTDLLVFGMRDEQLQLINQIYQLQFDATGTSETAILLFGEHKPSVKYARILFTQG